MFRFQLGCLIGICTAVAQEPHDMSHMQMGGTASAGGFLMNLASGTSMNPQSWPVIPVPEIATDPNGGKNFFVYAESTGGTAVQCFAGESRAMRD